MRRRFAPPAA
uniref:Uncharacterized protein n=1 Tax=Arundo donax TaxID=35708 RepID=A0A0A8Y4Z5_ARUDO